MSDKEVRQKRGNLPPTPGGGWSLPDDGIISWENMDASIENGFVFNPENPAEMFEDEADQFQFEEMEEEESDGTSKRQHVFTQFYEEEDFENDGFGTPIRAEIVLSVVPEVLSDNAPMKALNYDEDPNKKPEDSFEKQNMMKKIGFLAKSDPEDKKKSLKEKTETANQNLVKYFRDLAAHILLKAGQEKEKEDLDQEFLKDMDNLSFNEETGVNKRQFLDLYAKANKKQDKLSEKSKKIYERYQRIYRTFLKLYDHDPLNCDTLGSFFFLMGYYYSGSSMWTMYSAIRSWYGVEYNVEVKNWPNIIMEMKAITKNHVSKKAKVFTKKEMAKIFRELKKQIDEGENHENHEIRWESNKARTIYVGIHIAYYGLCRIDDLMKISTSDLHRLENDHGESYYMVKYEAKIYDQNEGETNQSKQVKEKRKNTVEPFTFNLPTYVTQDIDKLLEMTPEKYWDKRLIKNANKNARNNGVYSQGKSKNQMAQWGKNLAREILGKDDADEYTGHCWRRTGATCLADEGITEIALKRAGHWSSAKTALGYVNQSTKARSEQMEMLNTENGGKRQKLAPTDANKAAGENRTNSGKNSGIKVVDGLTAYNSTINMTTNIIITAAASADVISSIIANAPQNQTMEKVNEDQTGKNDEKSRKD